MCGTLVEFIKCACNKSVHTSPSPAGEQSNTAVQLPFYYFILKFRKDCISGLRRMYQSGSVSVKNLSTGSNHILWWLGPVRHDC